MPITNQNLTAHWQKKILHFNMPAGTSRGVLTEKASWYILLKDAATQRLQAIGECSPIPNLSIDKISRIEKVLDQVCQDFQPNKFLHSPLASQFPSLAFGVESALLDLQNPEDGILFPSAFTEGQSYIPINGLIWMGDTDFMRQQIKSKLEENYACIKIKIGALDFEQECAILADIRKEFSSDSLDLRVDANGAFTPETALQKLERLAAYNLHSIEQPIAAGQWQAMAELCKQTPVPIVLDEELIGVSDSDKQAQLLNAIQPQYIILKPSLLGGFQQAENWIALAEQRNICWWVTSALESAVGLSAIAQWTASLENRNKAMAQGLGTGKIYWNDLSSPLCLQGDRLYYKKHLNLSFKRVKV